MNFGEVGLDSADIEGVLRIVPTDADDGRRDLLDFFAWGDDGHCLSSFFFGAFLFFDFGKAGFVLLFFGEPFFKLSDSFGLGLVFFLEGL